VIVPLTTAPKSIKNLPEEAQKVWVEVFNDAWKRLKKQGIEDEKELDSRSAKIAWTAVKNGWTKKGDKWVRKSSKAEQDAYAMASMLFAILEAHGVRALDEYP